MEVEAAVPAEVLPEEQCNVRSAHSVTKDDDSDSSEIEELLVNRVRMVLSERY